MSVSSQFIEDCFVDEAKRAVKYAHTDLQNVLDVVQRRCATALRDLDHGHTINQLGILQGAAHDVDRICTVLYEKRAALQQLETMFAQRTRSARLDAEERG